MNRKSLVWALCTLVGVGAGTLLRADRAQAGTLPAPDVSAAVSAPAARHDAGSTVRSIGGDRWAVIVGVNDYGPNIHGLAHAVADAHLLYDTLLHRPVGSVPPDHVTLLTTDLANSRPTHDNIVRALHEMAKKAGPADTFWFYFAGHGVDKDQLSYLIPEDVKLSDLPGSALSTHFVRDLLQKECRARRKVLILDSCHSGSPRDIAPEIAPEDIASGSGMITLSGCKESESAWEFPDIGHGVFTYCLVRGLLKDADENHDGFVTAAEMHDYIVPAVRDALQKYVPGATQTPQFIESDADKSADEKIALAQTDAAALPAAPDPGDKPLVAKQPLGPALILLLDGNQDVAGFAENEIKKGLIERNFPLIDRAAAGLLHQITGDDGRQAAAAQAAKAGARFFLYGHAKATANSVVPPFVTVTATLSVELIDESGKVLAVVTGKSKPKASGTEDAATDAALEEAAADVIDQMAPKLTAALGVKPDK